jgi:hypothetical protein
MAEGEELGSNLLRSAKHACASKANGYVSQKLRRGDLNVLAEWIATYAPVASELVAIATVAFKSQRERDAEQPVRSVCPCY